MLLSYTTALLLLVNPLSGLDNQHLQTKKTTSFQVEAGALFTRNFEISGYGQSNATSGWKGTSPDIRLEYWTGLDRQWKQGFVFQPLDVQYKGKLTSDLTTKGQTFTSGSDAKLRYMFPSFRWTKNRRILSGGEGDELRFGGTVLVRYADVNFASGDGGFHDRNLIIFPLLNLEGKKHISQSLSVFSRLDFLPSPTAGLFLDGLFDGLFAIRKEHSDGTSYDFGIRLFLGGYDPKTPGDYANRINYSALVLRRNF